MKFDTTRVPFATSVGTVDGKYPTPCSDSPHYSVIRVWDLPSIPAIPHRRFTDLASPAVSRSLKIQRGLPGYETPSSFLTLAMCVASLGPYKAKIYGRYVVEYGGDVVRVTLLNGFLRVAAGAGFAKETVTVSII